MHLLWISGKCDACCLSWACYLFFSTALLHTHWWVGRRLSEKKKFKKWQPRSFHFMLHVLVQLLSRVQLFVTPGLHQVRLPCPSPSPGACSNSCPLSESCHPAISSSVHPLLLLPSVFPNLRVFSKESALHIRWPKYWSFSFSIRSSNDYWELISFRIN